MFKELIAVCAIALASCAPVEGPEGAPPNDCVVNSTCKGHGVCLEGWCVPATGTWYEVTFDSAEIASLSPDGSAWEGGAPNPVAQVETRDLKGAPAGGCRSQAVPKTIAPRWRSTCTAFVPPSGSLSLAISDQRERSAPEIARLDMNLSATLDLLRAGGFSGPLSNGSSLTVTVSPIPDP